MDLTDLSVSDARTLQIEMASRVEIHPPNQHPKTIAGCDVSYIKPRASTLCFGAVVLVEYPSMRIIEEVSAAMDTCYPYIPGLLSFREAPVLMEAIGKLSTRPDLLMVDGHGICHPRRIGLASHIGVSLDLPAIGCAKNPLVGSWDPPSDTRGSWNIIREHNELLGGVLCSRRGCKPLFISPGHKMDLEGSMSITRNCLKGFRLPEPTRLAHNTVTKIRRESMEIQEGK